MQSEEPRGVRQEAKASYATELVNGLGNHRSILLGILRGAL